MKYFFEFVENGDKKAATTIMANFTAVLEESRFTIGDEDKPVVKELRNFVGGMELRYRKCLLYTSDAADDLLCVEIGGNRITKSTLYKSCYL